MRNITNKFMDETKNENVCEQCQKEPCECASNSNDSVQE